ncbi:MAG: YcaQ family DNA glycosylase [Polyangiaceae bacterium]|nr:YcaQ family DNA glycosylase [Polyangiaceae bacterium]
MSALTLHDLRRYALARSLGPVTSLARAIDRLGFVQADPIRAPARAQDLTLFQRVEGYAAGDLERRYHRLAVEEEHFVNYGFLPRRHVELMHPRTPRRAWDRTTRARAARILELVQERGTVHPREVDEELALGKVKNYWGGSSNATTQLLDAMHFRGHLRVARREGGTRVYAARAPVECAKSPAARADALLGLAVELYAPLPKPTLGQLASRLRYAAPQLASELGAALRRAHATLGHAQIDGVDWYWPKRESVLVAARSFDFEQVRFVAPFDPVVWDRRRFEAFWGWAYRFEAYTPVKQRKLGYYALPLVWRDEVIGWGNFSLDDDVLVKSLGFVAGRAPAGRAFARALDQELERLQVFLGARSSKSLPCPKMASARSGAALTHRA